MSESNCRVCGKALSDEPLLHYENMPKAAQHFPAQADLASEHGADLTVCQCSACGLVQLSDPPVPYYRDVIRAAAVSQTLKKLKREQFSRLVAQYGLRGKRLIEIGCGKGEFLALWQNLGVQACGLENAETAVTACRAQGLDVTQGYIDSADYRLPGAPYDAFALLMFMEHMPDPNAVLTGIRNNLADDAIGLIEVPNFDMVIENSVFAEFIADHLTYFTRETLAFALQHNGFEVIECTALRDDYVLSAIVRKRRRLDLSNFSGAQEKISGELRKFIDAYPQGSVAIWGASHQALAMISLAKIAGDIKYVVDSAPFKQGRYTPASHLPIVSPDALTATPASALIIMAASYSDEVADIVRERFGTRLPFAILRESGLEVCKSA
ncbi:MAG: methyltransferase [Candidatus Accumulibacter sp. 66-26]|nr:methyltransferase domain-containing protein [Accumulibacter sp.]OJW47989.1 MAG: methyltransferase [Candidatus Accumulibacter sp. 66-26]